MTDKTYRERVEYLRPAWGAQRLASDAVDIASEADAEIAACRLRIAELEADAGRYRFLRGIIGAARDIKGDVYFHTVGLQPVGNAMRGAVCQHLDAAIDAALNSKKE